MNAVHKRILTLINLGGYTRISCEVGADDGSDPIYAVDHEITGVIEVDHPHVERVLEILADGDVSSRVKLAFLDHDILIDYSALPLEYFVSVARRVDDVTRWVSIEPNDDGRVIRGASVMTSVDGRVSPKRYMVKMTECVKLLNETWTKGLNDEFDPEDKVA